MLAYYQAGITDGNLRELDQMFDFKFLAFRDSARFVRFSSPVAIPLLLRICSSKGFGENTYRRDSLDIRPSSCGRGQSYRADCRRLPGLPVPTALPQILWTNPSRLPKLSLD